jgi:hypothetical protein
VGARRCERAEPRSASIQDASPSEMPTWLLANMSGQVRKPLQAGCGFEVTTITSENPAFIATRYVEYSTTQSAHSFSKNSELYSLYL